MKFKLSTLQSRKKIIFVAEGYTKTAVPKSHKGALTFIAIAKLLNRTDVSLDFSQIVKGIVTDIESKK